MNRLFCYTAACMAIAGATVITTACTAGHNKGNDNYPNYELFVHNDTVPEIVRNIVTTVYDNDSVGFSGLISYPLLRPYPLKDIKNAEEMTAYYNILVDDSLRNVILNSRPDEWQKFGWRGYSLHDGEYLWADEKIYSVNYLSGREREMADSLIRIEKSSLPKSLGEGWEPGLTLLSEGDGKIFRIDINRNENLKDRPKYRLSVYGEKGIKNLKGMPDEIIYGYMASEGSANIISYIFQDNSGREYIIFPDDPSTGTPTIELPDGTETGLAKTYWHELIQ